MKYGIEQRQRLIVTSDDGRAVFSRAYPHTGYARRPIAILPAASRSTSHEHCAVHAGNPAPCRTCDYCDRALIGETIESFEERITDRRATGPA